jgi:hypothetical protein
MHAACLKGEDAKKWYLEGKEGKEDRHKTATTIDFQRARAAL